MQMDFDADLPAKLFRLRGLDVHTSRPEDIGSGTFVKMVRIALSDPDGELWRYSVAVDGHRVAGDELARCCQSKANASLHDGARSLGSAA